MICAKADVYIGNVKLEPGQDIFKNELDDVNDFQLVSGSISLSSDGRTLFLNNARIYTQSTPNRGDIIAPLGGWIWSDEDLTVNVSGYCEITCPWGAISSEGSLVISNFAPGELAINPQTDAYSGIKCRKDLTFQDISVDIKAENPIKCYSSTSERKLKFINSNINLSVLEKVTFPNTINGFTTVQYENCYVADPSDVTFDNNDSDAYAGFRNLIIKNDCYDIYVCGKQITGSNQNDVLGDGKVQFGNKTLWLYGVNIESDKPIIESNLPNLNIYLKNENVLKCTTDCNVIISNGETYFRGYGGSADYQDPDKLNPLSVSNTSNGTTPSILIKNGGAKIFDCAIETDYIKSESAEAITLSMENAGLGECYIEGFSDVELKPYNRGCFFKSPVKSHYDTASRMAVDADGNRSKVTIMPVIICINGTAITHDNADDIFGDGNKKVRYDFETNTLTLNNAYIYNNSSVRTIETKENLNIKLLGENTIEMSSGVGVSYSFNEYNIYAPKGNVNITGPGSLNIITEAEKGIGIGTGKECSLTFEDCTVNITSKQSCIEGWDIIVDGSNLSLKTEQADYAFARVKDLVIQNSELVSHNEISEAKNAKEIEIKSIKLLDLYICDNQVNEKDCNDILGDGTMWYDKANNKLHLNGVNLVHNDPYRDAIKSEIEGLKIILHGENNIHFDGTYVGKGIQLEKTASIEGNDVFGNDKLTITSNRTDGSAWSICAKENLDIKNCTIDAELINGDKDNTNGICTLTNSNVKTTSMQWWNDLKFKGCYAKYPKNFKYIKEIHQANHFGTGDDRIEIIVGLQPGDVNGDGEISVTDMTTLINYLRSGKIPEGADLNGDKKFDLNDIKILEDILLER